MSRVFDVRCCKLRLLLDPETIQAFHGKGKTWQTCLSQSWISKPAAKGLCSTVDILAPRHQSIGRQWANAPRALIRAPRKITSARLFCCLLLCLENVPSKLTSTTTCLTTFKTVSVLKYLQPCLVYFHCTSSSQAHLQHSDSSS